MIASRYKYGMAGNRWARRTINDLFGDRIDFMEATETKGSALYLKQAWGAFGAAYRSQLFVMDLFDPSDDHQIPLVSKGRGQAIAQAFGEAVGTVGARFLTAMEAGSVTLDELDRLTPMLPSAIDPDSAECEAYEALLFDPAFPRAATLRLILRIAEEERGIPTPDSVRWTLYAGETEGEGEDLADIRARWFVYHADDLAHVALEGLLKLVLDTLGEDAAGMETARLVAACSDAVVEAFDPLPTTWHELVGSVVLSPDPRDEDDPASEASLAAIVRAAGRDGRHFATGETGVAALRLLATLHRRIAEEGIDASTILNQGRRCLLSELAFLDAREDMPFRELLDLVIGERVVGRHIRVALGKLRHQGDHTFLFESDDGRLRRRAFDGPAFTNPRLGPAITFLQDIHLLDEDGPTARGRELA